MEEAWLFSFAYGMDLTNDRSGAPRAPTEKVMRAIVPNACDVSHSNYFDLLLLTTVSVAIVVLSERPENMSSAFPSGVKARLVPKEPWVSCPGSKPKDENSTLHKVGGTGMDCSQRRSYVFHLLVVLQAYNGRRWWPEL